MFSGRNFSFHCCISVVLDPLGGDAAMLLIMQNYDIASCIIDVVDLVAYFEAERLFFVPNVRVFVSCDQSLFLEERSSCVAHPDPKW